MSNQITQIDLLELSTEEQQLISGGYKHCSPCYKPRKSCGYKPPKQDCGYKSYNEPMTYFKNDYSPDFC